MTETPPEKKQEKSKDPVRKETKPLTPEEVRRRRKMLVYPLFFLVFIGAMWLIVTRNFAASLFRNIKYFTLRKLYLCRKWMQKRLQKTTTTGITLPNFDFLA